ncbi:hypothetical protein E0493_22275 [Roseomonas sp. M0104]|uniref:Tyr recombinase domain-containing protein n=1 Tax=Teichococcus coralli TaxID=2545983 RepID=A0A845BGE7_9PROT|nr:tyrosine-type recombinase/integrase [Pseudoroseomonas coralli]MXP66075.1 hypothetical protein [Pseudoroseomonas coralli]
MSADPRRRCLPLAEWPAGHRQAWAAALTGRRRRSRAPSPAPGWAPATLQKTAEGYGRWLGFLRWHGLLDEAASPAALAAPETVGRYFDELQALGNADHTVIGRLQELEDALRVLEPAGDHRWIRRPEGSPVRALLPMRPRDHTVRHSAELLRWGLALMQEALTLTGPRRRQVQLRDGLLIAVLASRAYRLRSVVALRLGQHLHREGDRWRVTLAAEDMKNRRPDDCLLPACLTPWIERYLVQERMELLAGEPSDALWVNWGGRPLGTRGLEKRIRWRSNQRFGAAEVFGPHRFRHALATSIALDLPEDPHAGPTMLTISQAVSRKHYDRSKGLGAARRYHAGLSRERARTAALARNLAGAVAPDAGREDGGAGTAG